jgi:hypothetical protein
MAGTSLDKPGHDHLRACDPNGRFSCPDRKAEVRFIAIWC